MTPDLMPLDGGLYSGREQRRGLVNPDTWNRLSQIETQTKRSGFAEQQLDHQASAMWLAGKVDRPYEEVSNNLDSYGREYFGADVNASQIYDRIVSYEQNARKQVNDLQRFQIQGATPQATQQATPQADAGAGKAEPEAKDWQFMRTGVASLGQVGSDTIGGTMATIEGLLNTLGGVPDKPKASENPEYLKDIQNLARLEVNGLTDSAEAESLKDRIALNKQKLDASFLESRKSYEDTIRGGLAGNLRKGADFFYEVSGSIHDFYGSDPAFRDTTIGKAAEMGGSMMGSSALLAAGSLGFMGKIAGVKRIADVAGAGQIYANVEKDRMNFEGSEYQNTGWTFVSNAASAGVQQFIERATFLDNTLEKAVKGVPHTGGKINLGQFLRQLPKAALTDGIKEGSEEALQGAWGDFITDMSYNDQMVDMTNGKMDYLKRRTAEALAGFAGGVMLGGTFYTAGSIDVNRAATKAEKLLKHKDGSMLNANDFRLIRQARDDKTIKGMKHGEILLKAANGDTAAMDAYNKEIFNDGFVKTDGLSADGFTIGQFNGMPAVLRDDGKRVVFDPNNSELMSVFNNLRRSVATKAQTERAIADLQAKFNEQLDVQRPDKLPTIQEMVDAGTITADQAQEIVTAAQELNGLAKDLTWAEITPQGTASIIPVASDIESKRMIYRMVTNVLKGANPLVAIEEVSEAWMKKAQAEGNLDPAELRALREQWHAENGEIDPVTQGVAADRADIEWFSNRVMEYAVAAKHTNIVGNWWQWIRSLGDKLKTFINGAQRMRALMKGNKLDPKLESWFKGALGVEQSQNISERQNAKYLDNAALAIKASEQARVERQAELEAVFNDGIPSINAALKTSQQSMLDYEKLKADFQELQRLGKEADLNDLKLKAEQDVDALMDLPLTQLSDQARRALDRWETYSITSTRDPYTTFSLTGRKALDSQINGSQPVIPVSVDEGALLKNAIELAKSKVWKKGRDLKQALQDRLLKLSEAAGIDTSLPSPQSSEYLVRVGFQDALAALEENPNAIGWYDEKTRQALAVVSLIHPEIATDPEKRFAFVWALAVTSNGQKVDKNFELAEQAYVSYKNSGVMPTNLQAGQAQEAINKTLGLFNELKAEWGIDNLRLFMMTNFTVSEIGGLSKELKPSGEYPEINVKGASILGPKIGNGFFSNLYGHFDALTMDRWLIRTWGRWSGTLLTLDQQKTDKASSRLTSAIKALNAKDKSKFNDILKINLDESTPSEVAVRILKASMDKSLRKIMNQTDAGKELRKAGNSMSKYLDGQKEAPRDPAERIYIRSVFDGILAELNKTEKYADLVMADLQAALWYAEKRLYENAKENVDQETEDSYADDEAPDYANAASKLAREKGINEQKIQTTLKQESNYGRATGTRLQQGNQTQPVGQQEEARSFTQKEKRNFIGTLAIKRVRSSRAGAKGESYAYSGASGKDGGAVRVLKKLGVSYSNIWKAGKGIKSVFKANALLAPNFYELTDSSSDALRYSELITEFKKSDIFGSSVYIYPVNEYAQMRKFVTEDGLAGFAIKPDGDIVSVFSGNKSGRAMLELAVVNGGVKLDAFNTVLPAIYSAHGFKAVARVAWNDEFTPEGWDKKTYAPFNKGEPAVVYMTYDKNHVALHKQTDGKLVKSPEAAAREQKRALVAAGIPIKESYSLTQTTSKEFKNWFGESKVVDDQGKPLVVYHGTTGNFSSFDTSKLGITTNAESAKVGFFFTDSPSTASNYSVAFEGRLTNELKRELQIAEQKAQRTGNRSDWDAADLLTQQYEQASLADDKKISEFYYDNKEPVRDGANVMPVYLSINNPHIYDFAGKSWQEDAFVRNLAIAMAGNKDGAIFLNVKDDPINKKAKSTVYVAFAPTQIKSAIANKGAFDPSNPDITMSVAEQDPVTAAMNDKFDEIHTKQMQTTSKEFKNWFGESKVVDVNGKPLRVYHGTNNDFTKFKQSSRGVLGSGIYFADSPERASSYAQRESTGGNLVPVFLQIEKPLIVEGGEGYDVLLNAIYGRTSVAKKRAASQGSISYIVTSADTRRLRDMGHDGVIWKHKSGDEYLVFEPTQIKSAIGNKGTFDPSNPDITMSVAEQDPVTAAMNDKFDEIHTKQMQEMGFSEMLKQRNETYVQSIVNAQEKHNSPASRIINKIISPVDELLRRLGVPEIASAMRRNTADINKRKAHDMAAIGRLAAKKGAMSEADAFLFDVARSNGDMDAMNTLAEKYDFKSELSGVMSVFDRIRQDSIAAGVPFATFWEQPATLPENFSVTKINEAIAGLGLDGKGVEDLLKDIGYKLRIENYWPRHVIDYDEYIAYLTGSEVGSSELARAYQAAMARANADGRDTLTADELSRLAEMGLSELTANRGQGKKPSGLKERKIKKIPAEALRFYMKDIDSAYRHVEQMHEYVGALRFFGRNAIIQDAVVDGATPPLNVKETVRMYIEQQSALMNQRQIEDIREALEARFNTVGSPSFINTIRTLGYLQGMTQIYTPLTAVYADFWNVALESNTNMSTFINALYQGVTGKNAANLGDFNLDARTLHREFRTQVGGKWSRKLAESLPVSRKMKERISTVSLANTLDVILRAIGLNKFNELVQQTRANTQLIALRKSIASGKLSKIQQSRIDRTFREGEKAQLYKDIKDGKGIEDSDMIRYYLWAGIADYMPISMDQMPVTYLTSPRGRVFYMYKTFLIMQTAAIRRESLDRIRVGIDTKDPKEIAAGLGVLLMMISLMQFFQMPPDIIRAYIQNRPYILTDEYIYKLMGLVGFSHFAAQKVKTGDWAGGLSAVLLPPFSIGPDMQKDVTDLYDWPANYSKFDYGKLRLWNYTPVIGRMYQGWEGSDYTKREKEMKNGGFFRVTPDAKKAQRADQSREQWLFNRYGR